MIRINRIAGLCCVMVVVVCLLVSCSGGEKSAEANKKTCCLAPYASYDSYVDEIFGACAVDGFTNISEEKNLYYSVSIPENSYFADRNDLYEDDPLQPQNRKAVFVDEKNQVLAWISCLFSEDHLEKKFITIDEFPAEYEAEPLQELYPLLSETYECVIKEDHCIVLIKFYPLSELDTADETERFRESAVNFIQSYCNLLASQEDGAADFEPIVS